MSDTTAMNSPSAPPSQGSGSRVGSIIMLILGSLLGLTGLGMLIGGIALAATNAAQRDDGFFASPTATFQVDSYALTSPRLDVGGEMRVPRGFPADIATVRIRAESTNGGDIFIGVASQSDVDRYLASVHHSELREVHYSPFRVRYRDIPGFEAPAEPGSQDFWTASASGPGTQTIDFGARAGNWSVVVMNADASEGVAVDLSAGFRSSLLWPIAIGLLVGGGILFLGGAALVVAGAIGIGRRGPGPISGPAGPGAPLASGAAPSSGVPPAGVPPAGGPVEPPPPGGPAALATAPLPEYRPYPAWLYGELDPGTSRALWLVKWLLAIPHYFLLIFLWFALIITTIVAGFAILFTGRYPPSLFHFNVGVLRWNWRVSFYAYSALGTDRYPPFSLERTDYPADFDVEYPERLSNGLVLVKWWLLVIPHLLIISALAGGAWAWSTAWPGRWAGWRGSDGWWGSDNWWGAGWWNNGISVLTALVLIAAVILLFTGRYQRPLFDFIMGINRWVYRVITYAALLRDEYPPFRLDPGPSEPQRAAATLPVPQPNGSQPTA